MNTKYIALTLMVTISGALHTASETDAQEETAAHIRARLPGGAGAPQATPSNITNPLAAQQQRRQLERERAAAIEARNTALRARRSRVPQDTRIDPGYAAAMQAIENGLEERYGMMTQERNTRIAQELQEALKDTLPRTNQQ